jgi:hypothetical protein
MSELEGYFSEVRGWLALYVFTCVGGAVWFAIKQQTVRPKLLFWVIAAYACASIIAAILIIFKSRLALPVIAIQIGLRFIDYFYVAYLDFGVHRLAHPVAVILSLCWGIALNTIWFLYFRTSRRVNNVFGRNL